MADATKFDVGFQHGASLSVRAETAAHDALVNALTADSGERWHTLDTDDSHIVLDLSQIVYVRRDSGDQRVGF